MHKSNAPVQRAVITTIISRRTGALALPCKSQPTREREKYFSNFLHKKPQILCQPQDISFRPLYGYKYSIFLWVTCSYRKECSLKSAASSPFQREMPLFKASQPSYSFPLKAAALKADITCYLTPGKESTY